MFIETVQTSSVSFPSVYSFPRPIVELIVNSWQLHQNIISCTFPSATVKVIQIKSQKVIIIITLISLL